MVGYELNTNSSLQCQDYFYEKLGIPPFMKYNKTTKKSKPTMDEKALQRLSQGTLNRPPYKEASLIQQIRKDRKLNGTYLNITFDEDERFRCAYNLRGTTTGRLSSTKTINNTGMNHQNLPQAFRTFVVPDEGNLLIEWDKSQAEWVVVAYYCGDERMIYILENNLDAHLASGVMISGLPEAYVVLENTYVSHSRNATEVQAGRGLLGKEHPEWSIEKLKEKYPGAYFPRTYSIRDVGKHSNHGFNYDMGADRFSLEYEVPLDESQIIANRYFGTYYRIKEGHKKIQEELKKTRALWTCYGRKRRFLGEWSDNLFKSAYDFIPQSTVVDNTNRGILRMYHDRDLFMRPLEQLLQCHDAGIAQYPLGNNLNLASCILRGVEHMHDDLEYNGRRFSIKTDVKIGFSWGRMIELPNLETYSPKRLKEALPIWIEEARDKAA